MPWWHIYHSADTYTDSDKHDFANDITRYYTRAGLPEFYVVALFHEVPSSSCFVGGQPTSDAVRIVVEHLARHVHDLGVRQLMTDGLDAVMAPYTGHRGLHYEFHIDETPRDLWMIAGLRPPGSGSDAEKAWVQANKPIPYGP
ncbi:tautomerase family protein [Streptomyces sp. NPDC003442]